MKRTILLPLLLLTAPLASKADEGMWLLPLIEKLNVDDMHAEGFRLTASDIYALNRPAIKDAVVIFGGGCTGVVVSSEGLLLTNHHCGYGAIQSHSSVEHDYLKNGFWAASTTEEIPTPGLSVTFVREIIDVTDKILHKLPEGLSENEREKEIGKRSEKIIEKYKSQKKYTGLDTRLAPMFGGNQYFLFFTETFSDVRFVGAPPSSVGKFGGDTDNWMWPRHTGDFSVFRIYASPENMAAEHAAENVPYKPLKYVPVSAAGFAEGDFAMTLGFPGRTNRYMTTWEIDQVLEQDNPIRIFVRGERQKLMWEDMLADDRVRIQYSSKYMRSSNYWKNSIGMSRGLRRLNIRAKKEAWQDEFTRWLAADPKREQKWGGALSLIEKAVAGRRSFAADKQYIQEALLTGVESFGFADKADKILKSDESPEVVREKLSTLGKAFFKDYNQPTDRKITQRMLAVYADNAAGDRAPSFFKEVRGDIDGYATRLIDNSAFTDPERYKIFTENTAMADSDPAMAAARSIAERVSYLDGALAPYGDLFVQGQRLWIEGLLEFTVGRALYPDANFTMRMSYGQVLPYWPADAVFYNYRTTLRGVMEKEDPSNPEFVVPEKLKDLYRAGDYGRWGEDGEMPVNFLSNNDITGGNSGSPVLNGDGQLIGLAFDGNWEAMSGDIAFEPQLQRMISVDIRYVLFIIDKYAGAQRLIDEMTIVE